MSGLATIVRPCLCICGAFARSFAAGPLLSVAAMALHRLAFVVLLFAPAVGRIRTPDLDALLELFKFMGGMHWDRNEGWDPEGQTDPCNFDEHWFGVGCIDPCDIYRDGPTCKAGRVTALTLRKNNLTGSITNWTSVKHLANLTWLDMSMNRISGTLPAEFGYIQNIVHLNMRENKLQGQIPPEMGDINSNGYEQLTEFNFARNNLEGTIPSTLAKLTDLMMLDVSHNKITGSIPTSSPTSPSCRCSTSSRTTSTARCPSTSATSRSWLPQRLDEQHLGLDLADRRAARPAGAQLLREPHHRRDPAVVGRPVEPALAPLRQ